MFRNSQVPWASYVDKEMLKGKYFYIIISDHVSEHK